MITDTTSALRFENLELRFGKKRVLHGLDCAMRRGAVTALLGSNGAGKSTLLRLALGVLAPSSGSVRVLGLDPIREARELRQRLGYVPDVPDVWGWMKPRTFYDFLAPQYASWCPERVRALAERLEVPLDTKFRALSRGQGMKAMLVAALGHDPELLLLDEPFGGLDPIAREELLAGVLSELRSDEHSIVVTTHELTLAARLADDVVILQEGRVDVAGRIDELVGEDATRLPEELQRMLAEA